MAHWPRKRGMTRASSVAMVGSSSGYGWSLAEYPQENIDSQRVLSQKRRRQFCMQEQEKIILGLILDKTPDQSKMAYALWTWQALLELIAMEAGVELAIRTVG